MKHALIAVYLLAALCSFTPAHATEITFEVFGDVDGYPFYSSSADAVSSDGRVVAGSANYYLPPDYTMRESQAFRWEDGALTLLGFSPNAEPKASGASGISADGSVIVGSSNGAFIWENGTMTDLPGFAGIATGVSGDGTTAVGYYSDPQQLVVHAASWTLTTRTDLGFLPGVGQTANAWAISSDGTTIVGESSSEFGEQAFKLKDQIMTGLGDLEGGYYDSAAYAVSADGSFIVGSGYSDAGVEAVLWTDVETIILAGLSTGYSESVARGVSGYGPIIVGSSFGDSGQEAVMWRAEDDYAPVSLNAYLDDNSVDRGDWTLLQANAVSLDGSTVVGLAGNSNFQVKAFRLVLGAPSSPTWAGFPVDPDGRTVDTGDLFGIIDIAHDPWVYVFDIQSYVYFPESFFDPNGTWAWVPMPPNQ